ncbi:MAG: hypothetical protein LBI79_03895 [Nitrososphaerota archaeon]|jgi:hypothetical protein|nr:hypothetical protein [Nitrososphaerota archaeon]
MINKTMKKLNQKILPLAIVLLLLLSIASVAKTEAQTRPPLKGNLSEEDKAIVDNIVTFLDKVFKLDTSKYSIESGRSRGLVSGVDKSFTIYLSSAESEVDILCDIRDDAIVWCSIYLPKGSPIYTTPTADILSNAKETLAELTTFAPKSYLPAIQDMLNSVKAIENSTTLTADLTQIIDIREVIGEDLVMMSWAPFANGLVYSQNTLSLHFDTSGHLRFFADDFGRFAIGTSEAKVSEQEAIQIAMEQVQAFSWEQDGEVVSNVEIRSDQTLTRLSLQRRNQGDTLYPYWDVYVALDKMYPGGVTAFHVAIWADTGEIDYVKPIGFYGGSGLAGRFTAC